MANLWEQHKQTEWSAFDRYRVAIRLHDIAGGKPATPEIIKAWVEAKNKEKTSEERAKIAQAQIDHLPEIVEDAESAKLVCFSRLETGELAIEGRQVKAMLKEAANIVKDLVTDDTGKRGIAAFKSIVADQVFVKEEWIGIGKTEPDEIDERVIHVMTAQGPRDSIKRSEICRDVEIAFTILRRRNHGNKGRRCPETALLQVLDYAQQSGLGADRSQGRGLFQVTSVEKL